MFALQLPWWELVLRAAVIYVALLALVRLTGKRSVGQFTPFDLVVVMLLSEGVSDALRSSDDSIGAGLLVAATLVGLDLFVALVTSRSRRIDALLQGTPVLIGRDGQLFHAVMKRERVADRDVERALRDKGCDLPDMHLAVLEVDGNISVLKRGESAPGPG